MPPVPIEYDERGLLRFGSLRHEHEERLIGELRLRSNAHRQQAIASVEATLRHYAAGVRFDEATGTPTQERRKAESAVRHLREAAEAMRGLGPETHHYIDAETDDHGVFLGQVPGVLDFWRREIEEAADCIEAARGRPRNEPLEEAVIDLACLYKQATGLAPGVSSAPLKKPDRGGYELHGPFMRFCHNVLTVVTPTASSMIENKVRDVLRVRKSTPDWPIIPPEEMFS